MCAKADDGYVAVTLGTPVAKANIKACTTGCKACTSDLATACTTAKDGYYIDDNTATTSVKECGAGCGKCTFTGTAPNKVVTCSEAAVGYSWDATNKKGVICAAGQGSAGGSAAVCAACDTTKFCATCTNLDFCKSCNPGYVLAATTGICTAYAGTVHGSCDKANADTATSCQSCKADQNRELEDDSASTANPKT